MSINLEDCNLENKQEFYNFVLKEFEKTSQHASVEELAEFAFGDLENAVEEFYQNRGKKLS
jgi:hypothetical protein